ncbi:hypothetical protein PAPHI01_1466 [Pancytospora philotis]|nr:hypothetical protein PAPHI01_1466 [Pancytospora philotis]
MKEQQEQEDAHILGHFFRSIRESSGDQGKAQSTAEAPSTAEPSAHDSSTTQESGSAENESLLDDAAVDLTSYSNVSRIYRCAGCPSPRSGWYTFDKNARPKDEPESDELGMSPLVAARLACISKAVAAPQPMPKAMGGLRPADMLLKATGARVDCSDDLINYAAWKNSMIRRAAAEKKAAPEEGSSPLIEAGETDTRATGSRTDTCPSC